ncbi:hypothetical protein ES707_19477 [subsurface metagenome]
MDAKEMTPEQILARIRARLKGQHQHAVPQGEPLMATASPTQGEISLAADIAADLELIARKKFPGYIQPGSRFAPLKKLIRRLILVYTREQMEYNDAVSRVLGSLAKSVHQLQSSSQSLESNLDSMGDNVRQLQSPGTIARLAAQANYPSDEFYFEFEQAFRGSDDVKYEGWEHYAALVADHYAAHQVEFNKAYHLDVGCGRGEFLQHLKSRNVPARGVDSNEVMVTHCHELDLEVKKADALAYLAELEENSLLGISAFQFIEHLFLRDLCDFLALSHRTLRPEGLLILETVNPESVYGLRWFFMDFTHNKPLFADMIRFMLTKTGFRDIDVRLTSPVESWKQLGIVGHQKADENFHKLNNLVFGYQDYAVMARK